MNTAIEQFDYFIIQEINGDFFAGGFEFDWDTLNAQKFDEREVAISTANDLLERGWDVSVLGVVEHDNRRATYFVQ